MAASTLCPTLAQESVRLLRRRGVETVILAGADTHGIMRGKRVPIAELDRAAERGIALSDVIWALPVDEVEPVQPPAGARRLVPARRLSGHARDARPRDGPHRPVARPHGAAAVRLRRSRRARDPAVAARRPALGRRARRGHGRRADRRDRARVLRAARDAAVGARPSGPRSSRRSRSARASTASSRPRGTRTSPARCARRCRSTGSAVEACAPEAGPGQFEINVRAAPALRAADEAFLLKSAVKEIAARHGLLATFMAKPRSDWPGSSCHLHLSLRDGAAGRDAPLHRRPAGGDGRADRDLRPHAELLPAPDPVLVGGHDRDVERRQPLRRRAGDLRRRRHRPRRASPGRRRRQPVPRRRGGARRRARRGAARVRAAAARRRRRLRARRRRRAGAARDAGARPPTCSSAARWPATGSATTSSTTAWRCAGPSSRRSPPRSPTGRPRATWRRCR